MWFIKLKKLSQHHISFLKVVFFLFAGIFIFLLITTSLLGHIYSSFLATQSTHSVSAGLKVDLEHLLVEGNEIAEIDLLKKTIKADDSYGILAILSKEKEQRDIGLMGVTDEAGFIISRTKTVSRRGDNVFLTSPQGRVVATEKEVSSIEMSGFGPQLLMTTGRPVMEGVTMIGALFSNYLMDDIYAKKFREKYIMNDAHVIFYTKEAGVYGASFTDEKTIDLLRSYFNPESDWIKNGREDDIIRVESGEYYLIKNIVFPGLEYSPGGVLIFVPYYGISKVIIVIISIITLLLFTLAVYCRYLKMTRKQRNKKYFISLISVYVLLICIILVSIFVHASFIKDLKLKQIPYALYNSTMRLEPESGIFNKNFERLISILVDTGDESVNSVEVALSYDPSIVSVEDVLFDDSFCTFFIEKTIDIEKGEIRLLCGLPSPGFFGKAGNVANLLVKSKMTGFQSFIFESDTKVLANDGLGTNVLRFASNGSYEIEDNPIGTSTFEGSDSSQSLFLFSATHSNSERWYKDRTVDFNWQNRNSELYFYELDSNPDTVPQGNNQTSENHINLTVPNDGIFYFHLMPADGNPESVSHYKVKIDTMAPSEVRIKASETSVKVGDVIRIQFDGKDTLSGLQKLFYVSFDDGLFLPVSQETYVPLTDSGKKKITLRIYDQAGNYSEQFIHVNVQSVSLGQYVTEIIDRIVGN